MLNLNVYALLDSNANLYGGLGSYLSISIVYVIFQLGY